MGRDGQPKSLHPYAPGCVVPERTGAHKYRYTITEPYTGTVRTYLQEEVLHLRYASDDGFLGRSPVTICREALGLGLAQQRHGASIMKDGMMAAGIITSGEWLDGVKGKQALDALERYKGAKNAGKTPILEGGMDYRQLGMSNPRMRNGWPPVASPLKTSPECSTYRLFFCRNTATAPTAISVRQAARF